MYINHIYLPLFNFVYLFFLFFSTYFLVLFSLLYSPIGTLLQFCFPVCASVSFVLVDITFAFLCSPGQSIVLYFCWIVLILLMGIMYMCIFSHTFYCCYKLLPLRWTFAVLWNFSFFLFSFFFFFFIILIFNFLNLLYFFYIYSFVCLSYCSFPLAVNL